MNNDHKGFTLIELMIVISIIAIIAAIAIPGILSARRAANAGAALGNLKSFATAMATYCQDDAAQNYPKTITNFGDYYSHIATKSGYQYSYYTNNVATNPFSKFIYFTTPTSMNNGIKIFFIDESNRIFEHTVTAEIDCRINVVPNWDGTNANEKVKGFNWQTKT